MNLSQTTTREYFAGYLKKYFFRKKSLGKNANE